MTWFLAAMWPWKPQVHFLIQNNCIHFPQGKSDQVLGHSIPYFALLHLRLSHHAHGTWSCGCRAGWATWGTCRNVHRCRSAFFSCWTTGGCTAQTRWQTSSHILCRRNFSPLRVLCGGAREDGLTSWTRPRTSCTESASHPALKWEDRRSWSYHGSSWFLPQLGRFSWTALDKHKKTSWLINISRQFHYRENVEGEVSP